MTHMGNPYPCSSLIDITKDSGITHSEEGSVQGEIEGIIADEEVQLLIIACGHPRKRGYRESLQLMSVDDLLSSFSA